MCHCRLSIESIVDGNDLPQEDASDVLATRHGSETNWLAIFTTMVSGICLQMYFRSQLVDIIHLTTRQHPHIHRPFPIFAARAQQLVASVTAIAAGREYYRAFEATAIVALTAATLMAA